MDEYGMLPNIRRHSITVAHAALEILSGLQRSAAGDRSIPSRELIIAGALLHDIAKTPCLRQGCDHARTGAEICLELGYPEIAGIVAEHVILKEHDPVRYRQGIFYAAEIIYYADKRVRHEEIVSLADRLEYIIDNYGMEDPDLQERIRKNFAQCVQLEQFLFSFLPFSPDRLAEKVFIRICEERTALFAEDDAIIPSAQ